MTDSSEVLSDQKKSGLEPNSPTKDLIAEPIVRALNGGGGSTVTMSHTIISRM